DAAGRRSIAPERGISRRDCTTGESPPFTRYGTGVTLNGDGGSLYAVQTAARSPAVGLTFSILSVWVAFVRYITSLVWLAVPAGISGNPIEWPSSWTRST